MKRSLGVHVFISMTLGGTSAVWMCSAVFQQSIWYGVLAILTSIACVLNIICGPDTKDKEDSDKDEE